MKTSTGIMAIAPTSSNQHSDFHRHQDGLEAAYHLYERRSAWNSGNADRRLEGEEADIGESLPLIE